MKTHLVSGGCGFVGRNMVKRLFATTNDRIIFVDDLSIGTDPSTWLDEEMSRESNGVKFYGSDERLVFFQMDIRELIRNYQNDANYF